LAGVFRGARAGLFRTAAAAAVGSFLLFLFNHHAVLAAGRAFFRFTPAFFGLAALFAFKFSHWSLLVIKFNGIYAKVLLVILTVLES